MFYPASAIPKEKRAGMEVWKFGKAFFVEVMLQKEKKRKKEGPYIDVRVDFITFVV